MYECKECKKQFEKKQSYAAHVGSHSRGESYKLNRKKTPDRIKNTSSFCKFCGTEFINSKIGGHVARCKLNPIKESVDKKISKALIGKPLSMERREKLKKSMKLAVDRNPDSYSSNNVSGRTRIIEYSGFKLKGSWELLVAKWLDHNKIKWTNKIEGINYVWPDGSIHKYYPDFYLIDLDFYIEVKGYERDIDKEKWKSVKNLIVLKHKEIAQIKIGTYFNAQIRPRNSVG